MDTILQHWGLIDQHLDGILLSAGLIALFSVAEVRWPASRQRDVHSRIVNIVIGVIVSVFGPDGAPPFVRGPPTLPHDS